MDVSTELLQRTSWSECKPFSVDRGLLAAARRFTKYATLSNQACYA
jgi:hypothetical protein